MIVRAAKYYWRHIKRQEMLRSSKKPNHRCTSLLTCRCATAGSISTTYGVIPSEPNSSAQPRESGLLASGIELAPAHRFALLNIWKCREEVVAENTQCLIDFCSYGRWNNDVSMQLINRPARPFLWEVLAHCFLHEGFETRVPQSPPRQSHRVQMGRPSA